MKIAIAADHRGHALKEKVSLLLCEQGHEVLDMGTNSSRSCDYPNLAYPAARAVADGKVNYAILICGSGIGMDICANKVPKVRAALCHDELTAQMSRRHNNANVLCLASDVLGEELIRRIVSSWLSTQFEPGGRHERRVRKIGWIERGKDPNVYNDSDDDGLAHDEPDA
ncbi:MAG TPA: ribose 5-phosphate isomerase B [Phycisphaerae bacterium]|nr:ribose 5-phosphate isomerase B [Phycisphaerae bacterium]